MAAKQILPTEGAVLISVAEKDRPDLTAVAREFTDLGFTLKATRGTQAFLAASGIEAELILKMHEGRPNIVDGIANKEIRLVINTPIGRLCVHDDSNIRKAAIRHRVPYITTLAAAHAAAKALAALKQGDVPVKSLQEYHRDIT